MRRSIVVGWARGQWMRVHGMYGDPALLNVWIADRNANGEALQSETVVRLPRRFWVNHGRLEVRPKFAERAS